MNYIYRNNSQRTILFRNYYWLPDDEISIPYPVPDALGLTCVQEGCSPDPVLFHDDIIIPAGEQAEISLDAPTISHNIALSILCLSSDSGVECRFGSQNNKPIPIDLRSFSQVLSWDLCSRIFFTNTTQNEAQISVSAIESVGCPCN